MFNNGILGSLKYTIISSARDDTMTYCFPFYHFLLIFLNCLIALDNTLSTILNRYWENGQPCLIPAFSGNFLSYSLFKLMVTAGFLQTVFIMLGLVSCLSLPKNLSWRGISFCWRHFLHIMRWLCGFLPFSFFILWIILTGLFMLNHLWISGMKATWLR